jgi:hypothetical protein
MYLFVTMSKLEKFLDMRVCHVMLISDVCVYIYIYIYIYIHTRTLEDGRTTETYSG